MASRKNKNRQPPEIHFPDDAELNRMSMARMKVPTMNWQTCDLGLVDSDSDEEKGEVELTGAWRFRLEGIDDFDICGRWDEGRVNDEEEEEEEEDDDIDDNYDSDDEEEGREEEMGGLGRGIFSDEEEGDMDQKFLPTLRPRRHRSSDALVENFSGGQSSRGKKAKPEPALPPIKSKLDLTPLSGIEQPRFVWETESESTLLQKKREINVVKFQDTAGGPADMLTAEDEDEDIEELLSLEVLEAIRPCFDEGSLTMAKYTTAITKALKLPSKRYFPVCLTELFIKIDTFGVGKISWDDLCDFMQQKYAEKAETEYTCPPIDLAVPCKPIETVHRSSITRALTLPDRGLLTFSEDGIVSLWTADFKPRIWRALGRPASLKSQKIADKKANKWYTDIVLVQEIGKYVVPTGEKELQFYDTSTYDPYCQIISLYSVPIHIDAKITGNGLVVAMGDIQGNVSILVVNEAINTLRIWSQQRRINNVPTVAIGDAVGVDKGVSYAKFKVHDDMVSHLLYIPTVERVVTSSMDVKKSLTMGKISMTKNANEIMEDLSTGNIEGISDIHQKPKERRSADEVKFPITNGCRTFDVWEEERIIVAGGLDRVVWVWNLYVPTQPMAKLRGHNAAIYKVVFDIRSATVFSFCTEKTIRIWSLYANSCIGMFDVKASKLRGPGIYCFQPTTDAILIQTSVEASYINLKRSGDDSKGEGMTHSDPITAVMYNPQHNYCMTCSEEDILVWACETGKLVAEFNTIGGDGSMHLDTIQSKLEKTMEEESRFIMPLPLLHGREQVDTYDVGTVTAVALDNYGRRFFTAHSNGVIKAWNFYNGRNLYNLYKPENNLDICDMHYITINDEHRYLVTVGWDRRVVIYIDSQTPSVLQFSGLPDEPIMFSHKELNHHDDVWAVSFGFPNLIASGDYSGRLLVWNINSGHIVANLRANQSRDTFAERNSFITALVFHAQRFRETKTTYLISSGPYHLIHIWRANTTRELNVGSVGWNRPCGTPRDFVTNMKCFKNNNNIVTSDTYGCVTVWVIEDALGNTEPTEWFPKTMTRHGRNKLYSMNTGDGTEFLSHKDQGYGKGPVQLKVVSTWKAHVDAFAALEICETYGLIMTGGRDCSVRVWDMEGRYLGILGQQKHWLVGDRMSYAPQHPRDVVLDMKRVRALEIFRKEDSELEMPEVEVAAEDRARGLVDRKKNQLLTDSQIRDKAHPYLALMALTVETDVWVQPDAPVGCHRRNKENPRLLPFPRGIGATNYISMSRFTKSGALKPAEPEEDEEEED